MLLISFYAIIVKMTEKSAWLEINLRALARNTRLILEALGEDVALMAVVKSNAYGHGLIRSALTVWSAGAQWLCVNSVAEGVELRHAGIKAPILVLGYVPPAEIPYLISENLDVALFDLNFARLLQAEALRQRKPLYVHIKLDTGMHRLGVLPENFFEFLEGLKSFPALKIRALYSHLAYPENQSFTFSQINTLKEILFRCQRENIFFPMVHLLNSRGTFLYPGARFDAIRAGHSLYGLDQFIDTQPVLQLKSRVVQVKTIKRGEKVGYDTTFEAKRRTTLAVLAVGYADGYPRALSNKGEVIVAGKRCPVIGRVCMNMSMIDVSDLAVLPKPGQEVVLLGTMARSQITAAELASWAGTSDYEIVTRFNPLLPRIYVE